MTSNQQDYKKFLEELLHWYKERDSILEKIEVKLHEMKRIAEYARVQKLTSFESDRLNDQLNELKKEVHFLEKQLHVVVH